MMTYRRTLFASISAISLLYSGQAIAQESQVDESENVTSDDAIVVTAQRREQNAQEVPIALTIFGGKALQERAISDVAQLGSVTPNVSLDSGTPFAGSGAALGASIRGIGQNDFAINVDPGVGVYVDGIFLARTVGANVTLPDVERVEVLKGPQGTLFGRNTVGGAISVVTRTPGRKFAVNGSVTTGSFKRLDVAATIDIPLAETLRTNFTFAINNREGFQKRVPFVSAQPFVREAATVYRESGYGAFDSAGGVNDWTLRGKALWEPTDKLTVTVTGDFYNSDTSGLPNVVLDVLEDLPGNFGGPGTPAVPFSALTPGAGLNFAGLYNFCISSTQAQILARNAQGICNSPRGNELFPGEQLSPLGSVNVDADPRNDRLPWDDRWINTDWDRSFATGINFSKTQSWGLSADVAYEISDQITLRSLTGYRKLDWSAGFDADNSPANLFSVSNSSKQSQFSQELQALGEFDIGESKLNFVVGGYYFKEDATALDHVQIGDGIIQIDGPIQLKTENIAFFGQADMQVNSWLGLTFGARYTEEQKQFNAAQSDISSFNYDVLNCPVNGTGFIPNVGIVPCSAYARFPHSDEPLRVYTRNTPDREFSNFSIKAGVQLFPVEDVMVYGSFTQGYKSGGWSTRVNAPTPAALTFEEEKVESFEIGVKSTLLDGRILANIAAFSTDYKDAQLLLQVGINPQIGNFGNAKIKGIEADVSFRVNDVFSVNASVGYLDSQLVNVQGPGSPANALQLGIRTGADLLKVPTLSFNITPRIELPIGNENTIVLTADYTHKSSMWNDSQRSFQLRRPATDTANASIQFNHNDGWSITLGGTNITDQRYIVNGLVSSAGQTYAIPNRPREFYARVGFKF